MITWLKNKEKDIAFTAIAVFVGSWLLLFCQTCFATSQDTGSIGLSQSKAEYSCHTADDETDKLAEHFNTDDDHCLGVCDCHEITASLNNVEKIAYSNKFQKVSLDSISLSNSFNNIIATNLTRHSLPIPERAILLPFHCYAVLLI